MSKKPESIKDEQIGLIVERALTEKGEELTFTHSDSKWTNGSLLKIVLEFKLPKTHDYGNLKNPKCELTEEIVKRLRSYGINMIASIFGGGIGLDGSSYIKIQLNVDQE